MIGRHVVIYRRGARGAALLWVTIATQVALIVAAVIWAAVLISQMTAAIVSTVPAG